MLPAMKPTPIRLASLTARPVRTRPDGRWYWRAERDRATLGCTWATPSEAAVWVAQLLLERPSREEAQLGTVVRLVGAWLAVQEERADIEAGTLASYHAAAKRLAAPDLGLRTVQVDRLTRSTLDSYARAAGKRFAPATLRLSLAVLGMAWRWGRREGEVPDRDLELPEIKVTPARPKVTPGPEEVEAVLAGLEGYVRVALELQAATGARLGEIAALTWADVDLQRGLLHLGRHKGDRKTGPRTVPLTAAAAQALATLPAGVGEAGVFGRSPFTVRTACRCALRELGADWTPHALRRAMVDRMARAGVDIATVARMIGDNPATVLRDYRQADEDDLRGALEAIGEPPAGIRRIK